MDLDRLLTLTDAAMLAGCSRKALERRVERGSLHVSHGEDGQRAVRLADLMRSGLVALMPTCAPVGSAPARVEEAESELEALRAALTATEVALRRSREDMRIVRTRLMEAEARAAVAEDDLTRVLLNGVPPEPVPIQPAARRGRLRLRTA
jgi:hypothetical protein